MMMMLQPGPNGPDWLTLSLDGPLQPKERPRQGQGRSFTSPKYRAWLAASQASLKQQWQEREPLDHALVGIEFHGHGRSDVDNLSGAVLDAAVKAGVLVDDRCSRLPGAVTWWQPAPTDQQRTYLYLLPWWPPQKR
jgi:hypothetical protein